MTRDGTRLIAALLAAALAIAFLAACGSDSTPSTSSAATAASQGDGQGSAEQGSSQGQQGNGDQSGSNTVSAPLQVSGGGSEQFRTKGGDNSIQEFGSESDEAELEEAAEALHSYLVAKAEEDWAKACSYLVKPLAHQLEQLSTQSPRLKGKGCTAILKALIRPLPPAARRETTVVDAGSLRNGGEQSFLIFYGAGKAAYAMPMKQEDGKWRITALAATPLS